MDPIQLTYTIFTIIALVILSYYYWNDSSEEGFSNIKIFDSLFFIILGGLLGGKILFREISIDYFRYQFLSAPIIVEGALVGGYIALFIYVIKYRMDFWKIGDMIAPALTVFQSIIFLGIAIITSSIDYYIISIAFGVLFLILRYLRIVKNFGSSKSYFELKRYNRVFFTGFLITLYLTISSVIAILFLVKNLNSASYFWWFQVSFYSVVLLSALFLFRRKLYHNN